MNVLNGSLVESLREFLRQYSIGTDNVNAAVRSGKAFEALRQQLVGRYGTKNIVMSCAGNRGTRRPEFTIQVESYKPLGDHARHLVDFQVHSVNDGSER